MRQSAEIHLMCEACAGEEFTRGTIHQFETLEDGTAVVLREASGDLNCTFTRSRLGRSSRWSNSRDGTN